MIAVKEGFASPYYAGLNLVLLAVGSVLHWTIREACIAVILVLFIYIGAGIYEELLFRVVLVGLLAWGAKRLLGWRPLHAGIAATVLGALIFSAFHYIGPYGDPLDVYSFIFRTIAGLFFSGLLFMGLRLTIGIFPICGRERP